VQLKGEHSFSTGTDLSEQSSELSCLQRHNVRVLGTGKQVMFLAHGFGTNQQVSRSGFLRAGSSGVPMDSLPFGAPVRGRRVQSVGDMQAGHAPGARILDQAAGEQAYQEW